MNHLNQPKIYRENKTLQHHSDAAGCIYRRDHPLFRASRKGVWDRIFSVVPMLPVADEICPVAVRYPAEEADREDLEILGRDLYAGLLGSFARERGVVDARR